MKPFSTLLKRYRHYLSGLDNGWMDAPCLDCLSQALPGSDSEWGGGCRLVSLVVFMIAIQSGCCHLVG